MNRYPHVYFAAQLSFQAWPAASYNAATGKYVPARPEMPMGSILKRLRLAWLVFVGRYDALDWEN